MLPNFCNLGFDDNNNNNNNNNNNVITFIWQTLQISLKYLDKFTNLENIRQFFFYTCLALSSCKRASAGKSRLL